MGKYDALGGETTAPAPAPSSGGGKYSPLAAPEQFGPPVPPRTWGDVGWGALQTADDAVRAAANTVTFGMADRFAGAMPGGGSTDEQVRLSEEARKRSPTASLGGDIGGAVLLPGIGGRTLAARLGGGWGARAAGYGAEGAALGAAQGAGQTYSGKPLDYITNAATGFGVGGILGAGMGSVFGPRGGMVSSAETPTAAVTDRASGLGYDALRANTAEFHPSGMRPQVNQLEADLRRFGPNAPTSTDALRQLRALDTGPGSPFTSPAELDVIRRQVNTIPFSPTSATDREAGHYVRNAIDNFLMNPPPSSIRPGTEAAAAQAGQLADFARGTFGGAKRQATFEGLENAAQRAKNLDPFGASVPNRTAQNINSWYFPSNAETLARRQRGLTGEEINALDKVGSPGGWIQAARSVGGALTGGKNPAANVAVPLVAGAVGGGAGYLGDKPGWGTAAGIAFPLLGAGMRGAASRGTAANIQRASDLIHQRNPLYQSRVAAAPMVPPRGGGVPATIRDAMTIEMLRQQGIPRITVTPREEE